MGTRKKKREEGKKGERERRKEKREGEKVTSAVLGRPQMGRVHFL